MTILKWFWKHKILMSYIIGGFYMYFGRYEPEPAAYLFIVYSGFILFSLFLKRLFRNNRVKG